MAGYGFPIGAYRIRLGTGVGHLLAHTGHAPPLLVGCLLGHRYRRTSAAHRCRVLVLQQRGHHPARIVELLGAAVNAAFVVFGHRLHHPA